ncbi:MAG: MBL fold metallo-hydrolase [Candidatus Methylomirabilales bacterium]
MATGKTTLYLKQMEVGPMANFAYLVGSAETREVAVVDPGWEAEKILKAAEQDGMAITKVLITHTHFDHVHALPELLEKVNAKVYVHKLEAEFLKGLGSDLVKVEGGDEIGIGDVSIQFLHTPGHTPGSQCFLVRGRLISGDTLFIGSCGRCDLPGGDPAEMYRSLMKLKELDDQVILYPGHNYARKPFSTLGDEKRSNPFLQLTSLSAFLQTMGFPIS